ncbi:hypothetical protein [Pseudobutyrivibrio ruminis]|uniref:Uncharacterized protein n=1 Tax=Pseudobutyrivibrio ruminis TaxID=46206 RepID=A0A2G3DRQ4_9FIRM|nr:hypothetical protein [Pseudobutyrivibrio ruminis]PHU33698.1 hypothetical protein CSX01_14280 [Pseudobutyrivibrio ruminis]
MAIAPISGLTTYSPVASVQPMNYAVENTAGFSDVYNSESVKGGAAVTGTAPVQYPNARVEEPEESRPVDSTAILEEKKKTASQFNDIAAKFSSIKTSYNNSGVGNSYGMIGSRIDAFA